MGEVKFLSVIHRFHFFINYDRSADFEREVKRLEEISSRQTEELAKNQKVLAHYQEKVGRYHEYL